MTLFARVLPLRADPLAVARVLAAEPGFVFMWSGSGGARGGPSYAACWPVAESRELDPEEALPLRPSPSPLDSFPRWTGILPYEARRGLERRALVLPETRAEPHVTAPLWKRYGAVVRIERDVVVAGDDAARVGELSRRLLSGPPGQAAPFRVAPLPSEDTDEAHRARIERALEAIVEGEIYQVNLARRFDFRFEGGPLSLLERLARRARSPFAFAADWDGLAVAASSPELFLDVSPRGRLLTVPIKGTRPRGAHEREDAAHAAHLGVDPKESAELSMVVDVERNDLGRVARTGTVRVLGTPRVEAFGPVWHRLVSVTAELRTGTSRRTLLEAMLPSGSVTGAPKVRAMELIRSLEASRRGLYTGAMGTLGHDGSLRLAMAIRTVTARDETAHYFAGGGIVHGSDPAREVLETRWKAVQVLRLLEEGDGEP